MALNREIVEREADAIRLIAEDTVQLHNKIAAILADNSDKAIDWAAAECPAYITESVDGNLDTRPFTRQAVSNALYTFTAIKTLLDDAHLGNLHQLTRPLGMR